MSSFEGPSSASGVGRYYEQYRRWICKNPEYAQNLESTCKFVSFLIGVQSKSKSPVYSELMYCTSNLLAFFHDQVICNSKKLLPTDGKSRMKVWLTILEYSEAFVEVMATSLWGERGRWVAVWIIQLVKAVGRLTLLLYYKAGLLAKPPIPPLGKDRLEEARRQDAPQQNGQPSGPPKPSSPSDLVFTLKRSGKVVRKVEAGVPVPCRTWKLPSAQFLKDQESVYKLRGTLLGKDLTAELIHIMRPLLHLSCMAACGTASWKPWLLSLGMDLTSARFRSKASSPRWTLEERREINSRTLGLVFYLLRSPCYDTYTKNRLTNALLRTSDILPLVGIIFRPLANGIPEWQKIYSYMWSN